MAGVHVYKVMCESLAGRNNVDGVWKEQGSRVSKIGCAMTISPTC